jgi:hypothetical protein
MSLDTTIIYYTHNQLSEPLFSACQRHLKKSANGFPIVSVSHKPLDLGTNICVGEHKPSWLMLYRQVFEGVKAATTKYVAMAEHDCFYTNEHFSWIPPQDDIFYYNENHWIVQYAEKSHPELKGMYSRYWRQRLALSQLVCNRDLLLESTEAKLKCLDINLIKQIDHAGEPGITKIKKAFHYAKSGRPIYLKRYMKDQLDKEKYDVFKTKTPNLDVRHDGNFTGAKRGRHRRYKIKYWGRFEELINGC